MARRTQRPRTLRDLRAEVEAAEARAKEAAPRTGTGRPQPPKPEPEGRRTPLSQPRMKVVWAVCDIGGRPVATFPYAEKAAAEAHAAQLKAKKKAEFFLRSIKEPIEPSE
ncbi:hypothetical protein [Tautonia plasticadhaerens]|uniref:Uncharacterized protein n=1 Tax=Tautonia plasticadhaerens TaxID=2527974 RepID=A0A518H036_9BACT|nr:hypothetical protein [Tautonia plasticadhaerens]QDV34192.1 hypothetical protein ElP_20760 [Tautonia plasticadhaerens]